MYPEKRFGGFTRVDGTIDFYERVQAALEDSRAVLDFGCGRGQASADPVPLRRTLTDLRRAPDGGERRVVGMDVDSAGESNPRVDEFRLLDPGDAWPAADEEFDGIVSDFVLEHLPDPEHFFAEATRVLRPGGVICLRTTNRFGYPALAAQVIPESLHGRVLRMAQPDRASEDIFPTLYRCNSRRALAGYLRALDPEAYVGGVWAEPSYFGFSRILERLAGVLHRIGPAMLAPTLVGFARVRHRELDMGAV